MFIERASKDEPTLNTEEAEAYVKALMRIAARDCVENHYKWSHYANPNKGMSYEEREKKGNNYWANVSDEFKRLVAKVAGQKLYDKLTAAIATNKNVRKVKDIITVTRCEDTIKDAMRQEEELHHEGSESKEEEETEEKEEKMEETKGTVRIDIGHPNVNVPSVTAKAEEISEAMGDALVKALAPKPNMHDFVPQTREELELYKSHGIVPKGFLDRRMVAQICPGLADEMKKAQMPLIREERFLSDIGKRVALDVYKNAELYAQAILEHAPEMIEEFAKAEDADQYDLYKAGDLTMDLIKGGKPGLTKKRVKVTRGGKTFYQERWVREGKEEGEKKVPKKSMDFSDLSDKELHEERVRLTERRNIVRKRGVPPAHPGTRDPVMSKEAYLALLDEVISAATAEMKKRQKKNEVAGKNTQILKQRREKKYGVASSKSVYEGPGGTEKAQNPDLQKARVLRDTKRK